MRTITISVTPAGTPTIDLQGFTGGSCVKATEQIEIALGGGGQKKRDFKPEFHMPDGIQQNNEQKF